MSYSGIELDCCYGAATCTHSGSRAATIDLSGFSCPSGYLSTPNNTVLWSTVYPANPYSPYSPPGYWYPILPYKLYNELPPGWRVLCGVTIPNFASDLSACRADAGKAGVSYLSTDEAEDVMNKVVAAWEATQ